MEKNKKMEKEKLLAEIESAQEQLKDYKRFIDLMRDKEDPKGILTKLNQTIGHIEMLLKASDIKELAHPKNTALKTPIFGKNGALVQIRPCGEKYKNKTFLGFLIGEIALGSSIEILEDKIQLNFSGYNPAIFVPELGEVIYGCASWWGEIESEEELKQITDEDIDNVWYVKMLKQSLLKKEG